MDLRRGVYRGLELEPIALRPGRTTKYEPPKEELENVKLRAAPKAEKVPPPSGAAVPPNWDADRLGDVEGR